MKDERTGYDDKAYIGVDMGFQSETDIVIFRMDKTYDRFTFVSMRGGTEFEDIVNQVAFLMKKYDVPVKNLSVPRHPAVEHEVSKRFPKR